MEIKDESYKTANTFPEQFTWLPYYLVLPWWGVTGVARRIETVQKPHELPKWEGATWPVNWGYPRALAGCSCPCVWTWKATIAGSQRCAPQKGQPKPSEEALVAHGWRSLVSIWETEPPTLHFSTVLICKQECESLSKQKSIFKISPALQLR